MFLTKETISRDEAFFFNGLWIKILTFCALLLLMDLVGWLIHVIWDMTKNFLNYWCGSGFIKSGYGSSISSESGYGSKDLMTKNWKNLNFFSFLFLIKNCKNLLIHNLHKGSPSHRRSLQTSKETVSIFLGHFRPLGFGSGFGSRDPIESGSTTLLVETL